MIDTNALIKIQQDKDKREARTELELIHRNQELAKEITAKISEINRTTKPFDKTKITELNLSSKEQREIDLKDKRDILIVKAIGQMYNGILINNELTIREGRLFPYRRRYSLNANRIKDKILKNIHEVGTKLSKENLDILEYLLNKVGEDDEYGLRYNRNNYNSHNNPNQKIKEIKIKDSFVVFDEEYDGDTIKLREIKAILIKENGEISFKDKKRNDIDIGDRIKGMIYTKYYTEIKEIYDEITLTFDKRIANLEKETEEIKDKCGNLLVMAKLMDEKLGRKDEVY